MTDNTFRTLSPEDVQQMLDRYIEASKSIYAPSGPPDKRLKTLYKSVSSKERTIKLQTSEQIKIEVTFILDLEPLSKESPQTQKDMINILLHDGHRRLVSGKISVEESAFHDNPDRLVYSCANSHRSKIKKFINVWLKQ